MLMADFRGAVEHVSTTHDRFLIIGRRWDTDITEPWDFAQPDWDRRLRDLALRHGKLKGPSWIDYFCFSQHLYHRKMPPFLIGRNGWDPWLTWFAHKCRVPLVDASRTVVAVHQNHDYAYLREGAAATRSVAEESYNWSLGGAGAWHFYTADAATQKLVRGVLQTNRLASLGPLKYRILYWACQLWFSFLRAARPIRHPLGIRKKAAVP